MNRIPKASGHLCADDRSGSAALLLGEQVTGDGTAVFPGVLSKLVWSGPDPVLEGGFRSDCDDNLSPGVPCFKIADGYGRFAQWVAAVNDRPNFARFQQF